MGAMTVLAPDDRHPPVRPMALIRHLHFMLRGHTFTISPVVLRLDTPEAYLILLGCPWLHMTNIKQHLQRNMISFRREKTKVRYTFNNMSSLYSWQTSWQVKLSNKYNLPVVGIISHYFEKYISTHLIVWLPIKPLYPNAFLSKGTHYPFNSRNWTLWSLILATLWAIFKAVWQYLVLSPRKYSTCIELGLAWWSLQAAYAK